MNLQEIKEELSRFVDWYAEDKKTNTDLQSKINKVFDYIATKEIETAEKISELKKENAKLKADVEGLANINIKAQNIIAELKAQIEEQKAHCKAVDDVNEKMKCCENCKNKKGWKGEKPCLDCKYNPFGEGKEDKWGLKE